jgi:transcriptional regulator with XRE-family HTH domain
MRYNPIAMLAARTEKLSQAEVAAQLGISASYLCDLLKGRREPAKKVCDALGLERVVSYRRKQI